MADFPSIAFPPLFLSIYSMWTCSADFTRVVTATPAATAWPVANKAFYLPVWLPWTYPVKRVFWGNGSTLGNADFGVYNADGTKIYSTGSTAQSGGSAVQYVTPGTEFVLSAGLYYFAMAFSGTTAAYWGTSTATSNTGRMVGMVEQATALPLPATATFAAISGTVPLPLCGVTKTTTGF